MDRFALVPTTRAPLATASRDTRDWLIPAFAVTGLLSFMLMLVGLPLLSIALVAASGASTVALLTTNVLPLARRAAVPPDDILSLEARHTYRAILGACDEIERAVEEAPALREATVDVLARCHTAVELCGRIATLANPLQRYLEAHDPHEIQLELERLRARTEVAVDDRTVATLSRATAARSRQLETYHQMLAMRERLQARLELVQAALESFAAVLVKVNVDEQEQLALAGETVSERIEGIGDDLDVLESALQMDVEGIERQVEHAHEAPPAPPKLVA